MNGFYVFNFSNWKRWTIIVALALFTALFLWFERDMARMVFSKNEPSVLTKGNADEPNIGLTFNISWGDEKVHDILQKLEEHQVTATFFVSGEWAEKHPEIVEKIVEHHHELGMLGYRYKSYLEQDLDEVRRDLNHARDIFSILGHDDINLLRTPHGHFNKNVIDMAEQMGFDVIHWNVNPNDWQNPGTQQIVDFVMDETENGDIIILHASDAVKQTANALDVILPGLKSKGLNFIVVSELLNQAHAQSELIE